VIVQFFSYGDGFSKGPLDYLLGKDRAREHARILSGSEAEIAGLIDSSPYSRKYTSGCLSFYESDLSDEAKSKIMADFEKCLFPGLDQGQYRVLWIEHRDKVTEETGQQRLELNFLIPNVEVFSGKSLQPFYHKADMSRVDLFKKVTNYEYEFYDPDDPINRQPTTIQKNLPKAVKEIKATVNRLAETAVEQGDIYDRESLKKWLIAMGFEITNEKPNSLSIKNPYGDDDSRPIRLTGAIYEQDYRVRAEGTSLSSEASSRYREESRRRYEADLQRYQDHLAKKAEYHQRKYRAGRRELEGAGQPSYGRDHDPNLGKQGLLETAAERSHSRDLRADQDLQRAATERAYAGTERVSHSTQEAGRELTSELERVHPLERRNSKAIQFKNGPYFIEYSLDFSSTYRLYQHHFDDIRRDEQVQRDPSKRGAFTADRASHRGKNLGIQEVAERHLRDQKQQGEEINDVGIAAIRDYRAATAAAQRATEAARASLAAVAGAAESLESASASYRRARSIHSDLESETQRGWADSETVSADRAAAIRADHLRAFFKGLTAAVSKRFKSAFDEVASVFGLAGADKSLSARASAEADASRAREADPSFSAEAGSETRLSTTVSRTIRGFNTGSIFKALDELDRRRELQLEQQRRNEMDSGYDGPSF